MCLPYKKNIIMNLKNNLTILLIFFLGIQLKAQTGNVGVGTTSPDASAKLDVTASNKGVLLPQVDLQSIDDAATITSPATSLLVWNTGATWGDASYYYNDGTTGTPNWVKMIKENEISNSWTSAGEVTFTALNYDRSAGTDPTVDDDAIMNLREWKICDDGYVEETFVITSNGTGGVTGIGYYILTPQFPIDVTRHVAYSGNLNISPANEPNTFGASVGDGIILHTDNYSVLHAIPISSTQIALGTMAGSTGNLFASSSHYSMGVNNWQMRLTIKYKPQ